MLNELTIEISRIAQNTMVKFVNEISPFFIFSPENFYLICVSQSKEKI